MKKGSTDQITSELGQSTAPATSTKSSINWFSWQILLSIAIILGVLFLSLVMSFLNKGSGPREDTQALVPQTKGAPILKSGVPSWPNNPDFKHFEEAVLSMRFTNGDRPGMADIMPGQLFSHMSVGPGLNEVFISVTHAVPFKRLANSDNPAVQRQYRQLIVLSIAKQYNLFVGTSIKRPFEVAFYFLETLPEDAYRLMNPELLSVDRVWLLRFPSSYQDALADDVVQ